MDYDTENNWIKVAIELKGTKTRSIGSLNENDKILARGPFWNGIWGLKNIYKSKNGTSIVIVRGIGQAPSIPVIKKLKNNGNEVKVVMDIRPMKNSIIEKELKELGCTVENIRTLDNGEISEVFHDYLINIIRNTNINLIHCAGPDILSYKILNILGNSIPFSCCNNARMCCGEGVCGSCTVKTNDHKLRRLCKLQTDAKYILKGRRKL